MKVLVVCSKERADRILAMAGFAGMKVNQTTRQISAPDGVESTSVAVIRCIEDARKYSGVPITGLLFDEYPDTPSIEFLTSRVRIQHNRV